MANPAVPLNFSLPFQATKENDTTSLRKWLNAHNVPGNEQRNQFINGRVAVRAIHLDQPQIVQLLMDDYGVPPGFLYHFDGVTCLMGACRWGSKHVVEYLLSRGDAEPNAISSTGLTALSISIFKDSRDCFRLMMKEGYPVDVDYHVRGNLLPIVLAMLKGNLPWLMQEASDKFDLEARGEDGFTALEMAIVYRKSSDIDLLLNCGANVNQPNVDGLTPFMRACMDEEDDIALRLLAKSKQAIDLGARNTLRMSALFFAACSGKSARLVRCLLFKHGVSMFLFDDDPLCDSAYILNVSSTPEVRMVYGQCLRLRAKLFLDTRSALGTAMPPKARADITAGGAKYLGSGEYQQIKDAFEELDIEQYRTDDFKSTCLAMVVDRKSGAVRPCKKLRLLNGLCVCSSHRVFANKFLP